VFLGAAFANGFAGGIGTTTAVFCHELPHELGQSTEIDIVYGPVRYETLSSTVTVSTLEF